ncbi:MAG: prepilin peptidase [Culicoidibacterales bacterium]
MIWLDGIFVIAGSGLCWQMYKWIQIRDVNPVKIQHWWWFCGVLMPIVLVINPEWRYVSEWFVMLAIICALMNSVYDWKTQFIYDFLTGIMIVCASLAIVSSVPQALLPELVIALVLCGGITLIGRLTKSIASGDSFFLMGCSLIVGWQSFFEVLILASILGGLYGCYLWVNKRLTPTTTIAFTPFILVAMVWVLR